MKRTSALGAQATDERADTQGLAGRPPDFPWDRFVRRDLDELISGVWSFLNGLIAYNGPSNLGQLRLVTRDGRTLTLLADIATLTADRTLSFGDRSGRAPVRTDSVHSQDLPAVSVGATNLAVVLPGLYIVSVWHACTTAGTAGNLHTTIRWTDRNGAQSASPAADLSLGALGYASGLAVLYAVSGNVTYETAVTAVVGSPKYDLDIRPVAL